VKAAVAAFGDAPPLRVVPATATHLVAAARTTRSALTPTAVRPRRSRHQRRRRRALRRRVRLTVVRRGVEVDEVVARRTLPSQNSPTSVAVDAGRGVLSPFLVRRRRGGGRIQRCAVSVERHLASGVVSPPELTADFSERWQLVPAGARTA